MKKLVNYAAFFLALLLAFLAWKYPENVRGLLGQKLSATSQMANTGISIILVIGTGYVAIRQAVEDCRSRKKSGQFKPPK